MGIVGNVMFRAAVCAYPSESPRKHENQRLYFTGKTPQKQIAMKSGCRVV